MIKNAKNGTTSGSGVLSGLGSGSLVGSASGVGEGSLVGTVDTVLPPCAVVSSVPTTTSTSPMTNAMPRNFMIAWSGQRGSGSLRRSDVVNNVWEVSGHSMTAQMSMILVVF